MKAAVDAAQSVRQAHRDSLVRPRRRPRRRARRRDLARARDRSRRRDARRDGARGTFYVPTIDHNRYYAQYREDFRYTPQQAAALDSFRLQQLRDGAARVQSGREDGHGLGRRVHIMFGQNTRELGWFVKLGMTPAQALATATTNGAEILGMERALGRIAPGYFADIVAVDGDPLADINVVLEQREVGDEGRHASSSTRRARAAVYFRRILARLRRTHRMPDSQTSARRLQSMGRRHHGQQLRPQVHAAGDRPATRARRAARSEDRLGAPHARLDVRVRVDGRGARTRGDHRRGRRRRPSPRNGRREDACFPCSAFPIPATMLNGLDSLLSIVQMPKGVPVGTLAIGEPGAINAALLATAIVSTARAGRSRTTARMAAASAPTTCSPTRTFARADGG